MKAFYSPKEAGRAFSGTGARSDQSPNDDRQGHPKTELTEGAPIPDWVLSTSRDLGFTICGWPRSIPQKGQMILESRSFRIRLGLTLCSAASQMPDLMQVRF